jgi:uncharacterized membrane protein affecting hemolysin expression
MTSKQQKETGKFIKRISLNFRQKIAVTLTLLITFIMLISVYLVTIQVKKSSLSKAEETGRMLGKMIALSMGEDIVRGNFQGIDYALKEFVKIPRIEYCLILDNYGKIISSTHRSLTGKYFSDGWSRQALSSSRLSIRRASKDRQPIYDTTVPILIGGNRYGIIRIGFNLKEEFASIRSLLTYNLSLGIILIIISLFIAYGISSTVLSPLTSIFRSIESLSQGNYGRQAFINTDDEFEDLAESFNKLSLILKEREASNGFITKKVWENDENLNTKGFSGKEIQAAVLHTELCDFSGFINKHSPSESIDTINSFFNETAQIIANYGGIVDKFGDSFVIAIFPVKDKDPWSAELRATFAALRIKNNISIFNFKQAELGLEELYVKTAIALGSVIIGNVGSKNRKEFTCLGKTVNRARAMIQTSSSIYDFYPLIDRKIASKAGDFLNTKTIAVNNEKTGELAEYFVLTSFTNVPYFTERLKTVSEKEFRHLISIFGFTNNTEGFDYLETIIKDEESNFRKNALIALSPLVFKKEKAVMEFLENFIQDEKQSEELRATAISVLGWGKFKSNLEILTKLFDAPEDRIRANALEACIPLDFPDKTETLKKKLKDSHPRVCANAILGLWVTDDHETLTSIYSLLKSDNSNMRASAAFAVYFLACSRKFRRLFPAYSEEKTFTILPIIENILKRLKAMLESDNESERLQSIKAIGQIGDSSFADHFKDQLDQEPSLEIAEEMKNIIQKWEANVN